MDYNSDGNSGGANSATGIAMQVHDVYKGTAADLDGNYAMTGTISGNKVTFRKSWTAGRRYGLNFIDGTFKDLAGLPVKKAIGKFTISHDTGRPWAYSHVPKHGAATVDVNDVMSIMFSEVVQKGTGSITVFSKTTSCAAEGGSDWSKAA